MNEHQAEPLERVRVFANLHGKPVEVDVDSVTDDRRVTVMGEFGHVWTHGGWAEVTSRQVAIAELSEMRME